MENKTYSIDQDAKERVQWIDRRVSLTKQQKKYVEFQIKEAITHALRHADALISASPNDFEDRDIKAAAEAREVVVANNLKVPKSIYMAGEICMWDEIRSKIKSIG